MDFFIHKSWRLNSRIKAAWKNIENTDDVTPYLYFDFMKYVYRQTLFFSLWHPCIYYITDEQDNIVFIAPMKQHFFSGTIDTLGNISYCDITDFLYSPSLNMEHREQCVLLLKKHIGKSFKLSRINKKSQTISYLQNSINIIEKCDCVNIMLNTDYDSHIDTLTKSVRQNIRTAYNRLRKDGKKYELKFYIGAENMPEAVAKDTKQLYIDRQMKNYSQELSLLRKIKHRFAIQYIRHDNFSLYRNKDSVNASLYIDGKIAAFWGGIINKKGHRVVIPRLAIDDSFRFYSPGYILICETLKYVLDNTNIKNIDLCRGTEKYKTDLGGDLYTTVFLKTI